MRTKKVKIDKKFEDAQREIDSEAQIDLESSIKSVDNDTKDVVKKGTRTSFSPAIQLGPVDNVPKGHVPRWVRNEEKNVWQKQSEGWIFVNKTNSPETSHKKSSESHIKDGTPLGSAIRHREMVLMALPDETKQSREEYYANETRQQTEARLNATEQRNKPGGRSVKKPVVVVD